MLNLFGCSNWDFFICFFELDLNKQTGLSLRVSIGLFTLGQLAKENKNLAVNSVLAPFSKSYPGSLKCCGSKNLILK